MLYIYLYLIAIACVLLLCFIVNIIYINYERFTTYVALEEVNIMH